MEKQFTATVYIIDQEKALLIFHRKLQKWLPPGGHLEPNETPPEGARREALEETGLEIEFISQENLWVNDWNANSFLRPYMCLLEEIPAHGNVTAHQHMDMIYISRPIGGKECMNHHETDGLKWFTRHELEQLRPDIDIFRETLETLETIFSNKIC